jgi:hypothetical protein
MSMFMAQAHRGFALGAKYGVLDGFRRFQTTTETPKMDDSAMQGAIGIIIAVGGVLIALYIIAVVVGSISYAVTSGNIKLSPTWNNTITNIDSQAQATFNLANVLPIAIIGVGILISVYKNVFNTIHPYDCNRRVQRSGHLSLRPKSASNECRTLNTVATI